MAAPIIPASLSTPAIAPPSLAGTQPTGGAVFQSAFADAISRVESFQANAHSSVERFLNGEGEELHHVALATQQAELSFQLFMQVRNKIVSAYQEVMRMQV
ncbi:MAG: flagellar hook-basal body complex protein FliE [Acidobacteria bacterium]|jgi:flagellar hook-basal body complex protein FliE|nr:MAG: flagellar hook-basal body complex protein FliE [Acidobacteriota bacterium]